MRDNQEDLVIGQGVVVKEKEGRMLPGSLVWAAGASISVQSWRGEMDSGEDHALSLGHVELGLTKRRTSEVTPEAAQPV